VVGAILGYLLGLLFSRNEVVSRTVAIEVSVQNAGIGIALAKSGAFANPLVVLPSIFSGLWSCLIGSILAAIWSRVPVTVSARSAPHGQYHLARLHAFMDLAFGHDADGSAIYKGIVGISFVE